VTQIQTGSHRETEMDPWENFAKYGTIRPNVTPPPWADRHRGSHRATSGIGSGWKGMLAVFGITVLAVGSCGTPAPAAVPSTSPVVIEWTTPTTPKKTPASERVIEVVDRIKPAQWRVKEAAEWLDRYTASDMVVVSRCSGRAWKCVTVRSGKLSGTLVGWTHANTITIDTGKVARGPYQSAGYRKRLLAHELGHTFNLGHRDDGNLMATTVSRMRLKLTKGQRAYLSKR
jgi:hypothetical protein